MSIRLRRAAMRESSPITASVSTRGDFFAFLLSISAEIGSGLSKPRQAFRMLPT